MDIIPNKNKQNPENGLSVIYIQNISNKLCVQTLLSDVVIKVQR